jgi:D-alanyl-lipoteichoic acid acyltransferase DltB (MBOAT superfamily)
VQSGLDVNQLTAWAGSLCYALQLYFDFSGYSDMALGLGVVFGLRLPLNFNSPFKATNISDFWRRWHMTMTRFFTAFIYTPLAIRGMHKVMRNRSGPVARFVATAAVPAVMTFLVAGIWHGDGWTFIVYGLIHGFAIATFLAWRELEMPKLPTPLAWLVTMSVVVSGLVVFRAPDLNVARTILGNMWMPSVMPPLHVAALVHVELKAAAAFIVVLGAIVLLLPNSQQILHRDWVSSDIKPPETETEAGIVIWRPACSNAFVLALITCTAVASLGATSTFLYYQF